MWWHVSVLHSFLWLNHIPLYVDTTFCLSIRLLDIFFPPSAAVNYAAMSMRIQVFV